LSITHSLRFYKSGKTGSVPAAPAVKAAAKNNDEDDDNDEKCGVVHDGLLFAGVASQKRGSREKVPAQIVIPAKAPLISVTPA
jgi:hypothetical protein